MDKIRGAGRVRERDILEAWRRSVLVHTYGAATAIQEKDPGFGGTAEYFRGGALVGGDL